MSTNNTSTSIARAAHAENQANFRSGQNRDSQEQTSTSGDDATVRLQESASLTSSSNSDTAIQSRSGASSSIALPDLFIVGAGGANIGGRNYNVGGTKDKSGGAETSNKSVTGSPDSSLFENSQSQSSDISLVVDKLHEAFIKRNGGADVWRLLVTRSQSELNEIAALYDKKFTQPGKPSEFTANIKALPDPDELEVVTVINHRDGELNSADHLKEILFGDEKQKSERLLDFLSILNPAAIKKLDADFRERNSGRSIIGQIQVTEGLQGRLRVAITDYLAGQLNSISASNKNEVTRAGTSATFSPFLSAAVGLELSGPTNKNPSNEVLKLLQVSLGTDSANAASHRARLTGPAAAEALKSLGVGDLTSEGKVAVDDLLKLFGDNKIARDYILHGRIQLFTIAEGNNGNWFEGDNKKNVDLALKTATQDERELYSRGRQLAALAKANSNLQLNSEDKKALEFYLDLHEALDKIGNSRDLIFWEDFLLTGNAQGHGSIASTINENRKDPESVFSAVNGLSEEDWRQLHDPVLRDALLQKVGKAVEGKPYASTVLQILDAKGRAASYSASQNIDFSLADRIKLSPKSAVSLLESTDEITAKSIEQSRKSTVSANRNSEAESGTERTASNRLPSASQANTGKIYGQIKEAVESLKNGPHKDAARKLLDQISTRGIPATLDPFDKALLEASSVPKDNFAIARHLVRGFEEAPGYARHVLVPMLSNEPSTKRDKAIFDLFLSSLVEVGRYNELDPPQAFSQYRDAILKNNTLPIQTLTQFGIPKKVDTYVELAQAITKETSAGQKFDSASWRQRLSPDGFAILENVIRQNTELKNEDLIHSFVLSASPPANSVAETLSKLSFAERDVLKKDYARKYNSDLASDVLRKVGPQAGNSFVRLLREYPTSSSEAFLQNSNTFQANRGGHSPDGSQWTAQRTLDLNREALSDTNPVAANAFERAYNSLSAEKQEEYNKLFGEALSQYIESKADYAAKVSKLTTLATFAASFGPQGFLLTFAIAESFNLAAQKAIRGKDFKLDAASIGKDALTSYASFKLGKILNSRGAAESIEDAALLAKRKLAQEIGEHTLPLATKEKLASTIQAGLASGKPFTPADAARLGATDSIQAGRVSQLLNDTATSARTNPKLTRLIAENAAQDFTAAAAYSALSGSFAPADLFNNLLPGAGLVLAAKGVHTGSLRLRRATNGAIEASPVGDVSEFTIKDPSGAERKIRFDGGATASAVIAPGSQITKINGRDLAGYISDSQADTSNVDVLRQLSDNSVGLLNTDEALKLAPDAIARDRIQALKERQQILASAPIELKGKQGGGSQSFGQYLGEITLPDGKTQEVIIQNISEAGKAPASQGKYSQARVRLEKELAAQEISQNLFGTVPATTVRTVLIDGETSLVRIQDHGGHNQAVSFANLARKKFGKSDLESIQRLVKDDPALQKGLQEAFIERAILGDGDAHNGNFVVSGFDSNISIKNIDLESAFPSIDRPAWIDNKIASGFNAGFFKEWSESPLPPSIHLRIKQFVKQYDTPDGLTRLRAVGLSEAQAKAVVSRARWFADHGTFPKASTIEDLIAEATKTTAPPSPQGEPLAGAASQVTAIIESSPSAEINVNVSKVAHPSSLEATPRPTFEQSKEKLRDLNEGKLQRDPKIIDWIHALTIRKGTVMGKDGSTLEILEKRPLKEVLNNPDLLEEYYQNLDTAIASSIVSNRLFGAAAATVPREVRIDGQSIEVAVQEYTGPTLSEALKGWAKAQYGSEYSVNQAKVLSDNPALAAEFERASVERFVLGILDNHTNNFTVQVKGSSVRIRNIDFDGAFSVGTAPIWPALKDGAAQAIYSKFSERPLSLETQTKLRDFVEYYSTPHGIKELEKIDLTSEQIDSMITRANWLIDNKTLPKKYSRDHTVKQIRNQNKPT